MNRPRRSPPASGASSTRCPGCGCGAYPQAFDIRGDGRPVKLVIGGSDYDQLRQWRDLILEEMRGMPELVDVDSDYQERKPQMRVGVDRDRAATLGVSLAAVGRTLHARGW